MKGNLTKLKMEGGGRAFLCVMVATMVAVSAFAVLSMTEDSNDDAVLGAVGDYNAGDIAVINAMIDNNTLAWPKASSDGDVTAAWMATNWGDVLWGGGTTDRRIIGLELRNKGLTGALDVTGLSALKQLYCYRNNLSALDASDMTELERLECDYNRIITLDVSGCTALTVLNCFDNKLTALDVSDCTMLIGLVCGRNLIASLDVTECTELLGLYCSENVLSSLDVTMCTKMVELYCDENILSSLDVTGLPLTHLDCSLNVMLDRSKVIGFTGSWDGTVFKFDPQYVGTPLTFINSTTYNIPASTVGTAITNINVAPGVSGGTPQYTFTASGLPAGISISTAGIISGAPTAAGAAGTATVFVIDDGGAAKNITISYGIISAVGGTTETTAGGDGGNLLIFAAIAVVAIIAVIAAYWFVLRKK